MKNLPGRILSILIISGIFLGSIHAPTNADTDEITEPELPAQVSQPAWNVEYVGQIGGSTNAVAIQGSYAYIGVGPRLIILDISNPALPVVVGRTQPMPGIVQDIVILNSHVYVADDNAGLRVVDISNPANPFEVGYYDTPGSAHGVTVSGSYAYVADWDAGLRVLHIADPGNPYEVGFYDTSDQASDVELSGSHAYVVDGNEGLRVVNISNPANPYEVGFYDTPSSAVGVTISGSYAYVADLESGLRVVNISNPANPYEVGFYDTPGNTWGLAISGIYAYVADAYAGLRVVNIANPADPYEVGFYDTPSSAVGVTISGSYAYVANSRAGMRVITISDPANPHEVGFYDEKPNIPYSVAVSGKYAYVTDWDAGLRVVDISNPANPFEVGFYDTPGHSMGVAIAGSYAYVADDYAGLRVVDISNPANPFEVDFYDTPGSARGVTISGGYAYVADRYDGLRVVNIADPADPYEVGFYDTLGESGGVATSGSYAYVADGYDGLRVVNIANPADPYEVGFYDTLGYSYGVAISGSYAYVADGEAGLRLVNISNPANPYEVGFYDTPGHSYGIAVSGSHAYVAAGFDGLQVVDISNPADVYKVGSFGIPSHARDVVISDSYTYLAVQDAGLYVLRYTDPINQVELDVAQSTIQMARSILPTKQSQPYVTTLETSVTNRSSEQANQVSVEFFDGEPLTGTLIASTIVSSISPYSSIMVQAEWFAESSPAVADIYVKVSSAEPDATPSNNISSEGTSAYIAFSDFTYDPHTFKFKNWEATWTDFRNELLDYASSPVWEYIVGPFLYTATAIGGHCYGMSQASIIYKDTPLAKPVTVLGMDTFDMEQSDVAMDLHDHQMRQLLYAYPIRLASELLPHLASPANAYQEVRQRLSAATPIPSVFSYWDADWAHSVVAYKVIEIGGDKALVFYDNNDPMPTDGILEPYNGMRLDEDNNQFKQGDLAINRAITTDPVRDQSEITAEMIEDIYKYVLQWLSRQGLLQGFFSWGEVSIRATTATNHWLITDSLGRQLGYDQGIFVNDIPDAEFRDYGTGFYWQLPMGSSYNLETVGMGTTGAALSFAIPISGGLVQETVFSDFSLPYDATATTTFSQETTDWRIKIEGQEDVLPTVNQQTEVDVFIFLYLPIVTN